MEKTKIKTTKPIVNGDEMRRLRFNKGYTLRDVARQSGVNRSTLTSYEKGGHSADPKTLIKIAKFYGVEAVDLVVE